eukprot:jgi/Tetstr1/464680/TSEL_009432.t1
MVLYRFAVAQCAAPAGAKMLHHRQPRRATPVTFRSRRRAAALAPRAVTSPVGQEAKQGPHYTAGEASQDVVYDAVVVGSGIGGLTAATGLAAKGAKVAVLEKYTIPGGSAGMFRRGDAGEYVFDVGSSMMFGFGNKGYLNLLTRALAVVGKQLETIPDPNQVIYHMPASERFPEGWKLEVPRSYKEFLVNLAKVFPAEAAGTRKFYDEAWKVFNSLNVCELKSLEDPGYLLEVAAKNPMAGINLLNLIGLNTGDVARRFIKDEELLRFLDIECFVFSTVPAEITPFINAGVVFSDRHYGGVRYPKGGVGRIAEELAEGLVEYGGVIEYGANVTKILTKPKLGGGEKAYAVKLADGREIRGRSIISNATRWTTFQKLLPVEKLPETEKLFLQRYRASPSFLSIHMAVRADVVPSDDDCHHIFLDDWGKLEESEGVLFVSIPSLLDDSLCPPGTHIVHAFSPYWMEPWKGLSPEEYEQRKEEVANRLLERLEKRWPGMREATIFREVGTPRTHRRYLGREDGTYGPIPAKRLNGMLGMPLSRTEIDGLYCCGDSTFPGQGVNAVALSGTFCAHRVGMDLGMVPKIPLGDEAFKGMLFKVLEMGGSP